MKGTLRKVDGGIVFTIDERPKLDDWGCNTIMDKCLQYDSRKCPYVDYTDHKVIASTFGVGLELVINFKKQKLEKYLFSFLVDNVFNTKYLFTVQNNKVIIEL